MTDHDLYLKMKNLNDLESAREWLYRFPNGTGGYKLWGCEGDVLANHIIAAQHGAPWIDGDSAPSPSLSTPEVDSIGEAGTPPPVNQ